MTGRARSARLVESWSEARGRKLKVAELFPSIQGEGTRAGVPTVFLRLTGCALRCRWCDTEWAFHGGTWEEIDALAERIASYRLPAVCITGGEPMLQPSVVPLAAHLAAERGLDVVIETGGDQDLSAVPDEVACIVDMKLPGSGMAERMRPWNFENLRDRDEVKMVVSDRGDYEAARRHVRVLRRRFQGAILLSPVAGEIEPSDLAGWILEDRLPARMQIQMHKVVWPGVEKGV